MKADAYNFSVDVWSCGCILGEMLQVQSCRAAGASILGEVLQGGDGGGGIMYYVRAGVCARECMRASACARICVCVCADAGDGR